MTKISSAEEDLEKIDACLAGKKEAFGFLFEKYRTKVFSIAYKYVQNKEDALDVVQEVFSKTYVSLAKFQRKSSFYTWLCRIAINKSIDYTRARKSNISLEPYMTEGDPTRPSNSSAPEGLGGGEFERDFYQAIHSLPDIHKSVFVLYALEDLSYKDISDVLDCSIGTVMSRLHYARKKLQEMLKNYQGD